MSNVRKELYEFDKFRLDVSERILWREGERVPLSEKAFDTLCALVRRGNHLVGKDELLNEVWADAIVEKIIWTKTFLSFGRFWVNGRAEGNSSRQCADTVSDLSPMSVRLTTWGHGDTATRRMCLRKYKKMITQKKKMLRKTTPRL